MGTVDAVMEGEADSAEPRLLMPITRRFGPLESLLIHPAGGGLSQYLTLAGRLARHGSVHGIRAAGLLPDEEPQSSVVDMTETYLELLEALPRRPNLLVGWSLGGVIAWEMAARLGKNGPAPAVVMIDSFPDRRLAEVAAGDALPAAIERTISALDSSGGAEQARRTARAHIAAVVGHRVEASCDAEALLISCTSARRTEQIARWQELASRLTVRHLDCGHFDVFQPGHELVVLRCVDEFLASLTGASEREAQ